ncbi:MAG: ATP-dependent helicase HrpB [Pseudomonadota bacterium]
MSLPIEPLLTEIVSTLRSRHRLILGAPPGAGKTTRVPLALAGFLDGFAPLDGKVIMLEPRRIAARMAAQRMAQTLGEKVGQRVGLATRVDRRVSDKTQIEVVTDGVFTRRLLADPELTGVQAVIFDEIHERSLNADLGLALALEAQSALREDLLLLAMSATLDTDLMAKTLDAPVMESAGRQYPIETRYLGRGNGRLEDQMVRAIERALRETKGSILAFLPGAGEIRRVAERLTQTDRVTIAPLFGALSPQEQDAAIRPSPQGERKVVLATDIAESALTIEGVSVVIDSGYARVPRYVPGSVSTELQTIRAARANVDQRRGRAGRLGPGICYRLWDEAETRGLTPAPEPEILTSDLSNLLLTLSDWGETDPARLTWLTPPPSGRLAAAQKDLQALGAIEADGGLTTIGRAMSKLPLSPRQSALIVGAEIPEERALAAQVAALMSERGMGGSSPDLNEHLARFQSDRSPRARSLRGQAERWGGAASPRGNIAHILAKSWPDMIAKRRPGSATQYVLSSGRAGQVDEASPLAKSDWLVVADLIGGAKSARITLAATIAESAVLKLGKVSSRDVAEFDPANGSFKGRRLQALGAITISEQPLPKPDVETANAAFIAHLCADGFGPTGLADIIHEHVSRMQQLRKLYGDVWPDWSVEALAKSSGTWLAGALDQRAFSIPSAGTLLHALKAQLDWPLPRDLDQKAPLTIALPSGRKARIDWLDERAPLLECKAQELYGTKQHLSVADGRLPITLQILSPGGKPVATTRDLPNFWRGGYQDMVKDMRGRYPKHDWPDDPANAKPHAGMTKARLAKS